MSAIDRVQAFRTFTLGKQQVDLDQLPDVSQKTLQIFNQISPLPGSLKPLLLDQFPFEPLLLDSASFKSKVENLKQIKEKKTWVVFLKAALVTAVFAATLFVLIAGATYLAPLAVLGLFTVGWGAYLFLTAHLLSEEIPLTKQPPFQVFFSMIFAIFGGAPFLAIYHTLASTKAHELNAKIVVCEEEKKALETQFNELIEHCKKIQLPEIKYDPKINTTPPEIPMNEFIDMKLAKNSLDALQKFVS